MHQERECGGIQGAVVCYDRVVAVSPAVMIVHQHPKSSTRETRCQFAPDQTRAAEAVDEDDLEHRTLGSPIHTPSYSLSHHSPVPGDST